MARRVTEQLASQVAERIAEQSKVTAEHAQSQAQFSVEHIGRVMALMEKHRILQLKHDGLELTHAPVPPTLERPVRQERELPPEIAGPWQAFQNRQAEAMAPKPAVRPSDAAVEAMRAEVIKEATAALGGRNPIDPDGPLDEERLMGELIPESY